MLYCLYCIAACDCTYISLLSKFIPQYWETRGLGGNEVVTLARFETKEDNYRHIVRCAMRYWNFSSVLCVLLHSSLVKLTCIYRIS